MDGRFYAIAWVLQKILNDKEECWYQITATFWSDRNPCKSPSFDIEEGTGYYFYFGNSSEGGKHKPVPSVSPRHLVLSLTAHGRQGKELFP